MMKGWKRMEIFHLSVLFIILLLLYWLTIKFAWFLLFQPEEDRKVSDLLSDIRQTEHQIREIESKNHELPPSNQIS